MLARQILENRVGVFDFAPVGSYAHDPARKAANDHVYGLPAPGSRTTASGISSYEEFHPFGTSSYRAANSGIEVSAKRYRYIGKERDEETGLYYCEARYYACWLGRWTAADPIGLGDGVNRYAYSRGNPIKLSDPSGTAPPHENEDADRSDVDLEKRAPETQRGIDFSVLERPTALPRFPEQLKEGGTAGRTREVQVVVDPSLDPGTATSQMGRPFLVDASEGSKSKFELGVVQILRVAPDIAESGPANEQFRQDVLLKDGRTSPALVQHEEAHLNIAQEAFASALRQDPRVAKVSNRQEALSIVAESRNKSIEIERFVSAKFDVRTAHGGTLRPEQRFERPGRIAREVRHAEQLRDRNPEKFQQRLERRERQALRSQGARVPERIEIDPLERIRQN